VNGGRAGGNYRITLDPDAEAPLALDGLVDDVPVEAGRVIEIVTTGGGGWGDPLEREPELVRLDVVRGLVSRSSASAEYGVVFHGDGEAIEIDQDATARTRDELRAARPPREMFDRGPYFRSLSPAEEEA
jgi:N-methylhydantoinase B